MTNEEAIKILMNAYSRDSFETNRAIAIAIQALEKQIAKRIVIKKEYAEDLDVDFKVCRCPSCDNEVYKYIHIGPIASFADPYCWECGQRLNWEV